CMVSGSPSNTVISGLINTSGLDLSSDTSMVMMRSCTFTRVAAWPMPGAECMLSYISLTMAHTRSFTSATGAALVRKRGSGYSKISSKAIELTAYIEQCGRDLLRCRSGSDIQCEINGIRQ